MIGGNAIDENLYENVIIVFCESASRAMPLLRYFCYLD